MGVQRIYLACLLSASSYRDLYAPEVLKGNLFPLQSFYEETTSKKGVVSGLLKEYPKVKMMLDSGAHSFIHKAAEKGITYDSEGKVTVPDETLDRLPQNIRQLVLKSVGESTNFQGFLKQSASRYVTDYSYFDSKEVLDYLDAYIEWIHEHKDSLHVYVNLDVPFNGQRSWDNQKYMESCGLNPIPVFHFAEDFKWLKKYIDNYDYIGIGGIGQDITKRKYIEQMANPIFKMIRESGKDIKVHGFAVTSLDLIARYKWFSVDSTSWLKFAAYGMVILPLFNPKTGEPDYTKPPTAIKFSDRPPEERKNKAAPSMNSLTILQRERARQYFKENGIDEAKLTEHYKARCWANALFYRRVMNYYATNDVEPTFDRSQKKFF